MINDFLICDQIFASDPFKNINIEGPLSSVLSVAVVAEHCYTVCFMFYWLNNNNQTDQREEMEGLDVEGFEGKIVIGEGGCE
jgi:hypothetical protein